MLNTLRLSHPKNFFSFWSHDRHRLFLMWVPIEASLFVFLKRSFLNARSTHSNPILITLRDWKSVVLRSMPLSGGGAVALNQAVGDQSGVVQFFKQDISHLGGLLPINKRSEDSLGYAEKALNQSISVQAITLDQFFIENRLQHIDLLKIDVQGFETAVLNGAKKVLQKTSCCTVEVSFYDFYENSSSLLLVEQAMHNAGMILWDISKVSKNPKNLRTDWAELVYVRRGQ